MLQMNRLVSPLVIHCQNCCLLSPWNVNHYSTRVTSKSTALFSSSGHYQTSFKAPAPSVRSFSSNSDEPNNYDSKIGAEPQSNGYRNNANAHNQADLQGRPFSSIDNRWQGLLHNSEKVNDSTLGFPSYSGPLVSLASAMQSNVPKPYSPNNSSSFPTHQNMPGGGVKGQQRFLYGSLHGTHPSNQKKDDSYPVKFAVPLQPTTEAKTTHIPETLNQPSSADCQKTEPIEFDTNNQNQSVHEEGNDVNVLHHIQSSVSEPFIPSQTVASSLNNHGVGNSNEVLNQKYVPDSLQKAHFPRHFSHSGSTLSLQPQVTYSAPSPEGIQGNDCIYFELWMESCLRYGLSNCEEQLQNLKTGRKTLQQVLDEQQKIIEEVALNNKNKSSLNQATNAWFDTSGAPVAMQLCGRESLLNSNEMVPDNGQKHSLQHTYQQRHQDFKDRQKTVEPVLNRIGVFSLQQQQLQHHHHHHHHQQQQRMFSTSCWFSNLKGSTPANKQPEPKPTSTTNPTPDDVSSTSEAPPPELTRRQQLQRAVKEYGSTVMVFHVTISLMSLGSFYLAVSSGIDLVGLLMKLGIGENILQSRLASGASTFVVAYAVHKVFAPVRIGITLSATPLIVKYLRLKGVLKPPKPKSVLK